MTRRVPLALAWLALAAGPASAASATNVVVTVAPGVGALANTMTVSDASGAGETNYPLQFGRPFIDGVIARAPQVLIDGRPAATQADVKNRYADGSVAFAVIAVVIPQIPANGVLTLSFQNQTANSNTPLTSAQLLGSNYNFDAAMRLSFPARIVGGAAAPLAQWRAVTNGGFAITAGGAAYQVTGLDFAAVTSIDGVRPVLQAGVKAAAAPVVIAEPVGQGGARAFTIQTIATGPAASLGYAAAPASGTDISAMLGLTAASRLNANLAGAVGAASARAMLAEGLCRNWTSGPIAQTIMCGDDSAGRAYDIGDGDGFHPFRPRFYATFWPQTNQVFVRAVGENGLTTELEDLAYQLQITGGSAAPATEYSADLTGDQATNPKLDWSLSRWSRTFWLANGVNGGAPSAQVNIDNNLAYLESTRFIPNYDTAIDPSAGFAAYYTAYTSHPHDLYDGNWDGGIWANYGEQTGARQDIGPFTQWNVMWLYGGDWRMRQVALGLDDLGAAVPLNLRESASGRRLSRADPAGASTGLGHTVSITDRKTLLTYGPGNLTDGAPADNPVIVGPLDLYQPWSTGAAASHQPDNFFVPYVLTGDPWYLSELNAWAGFTAAMSNNRGPSGDFGGINDQLRGGGWALRNRAETAFIEPDGAPEKAYFTYLVNDALAHWEGGLGITGTALDGSPEKVWGAAQGDYYTNNGGPQNGKAPPLGNWESNGNPASAINEAAFAPNAVGSITAPWMQWYVLYALGRAKELGFAAEPLLAHTAPYLNGMIDDSGLPDLIGIYSIPVEQLGGGFYTSWSAVIGALDPTYAASGLAAYVGNQLYSTDSYPAYATAAAAMTAGEAGGMQAWSWIRANVYSKIPWATAPKWNILPRTDTNALPPQPTATPPG